MKEDYCSFKVSKLLKEKGFDFENQSEGIKELLSLEYNEIYFTITHALATKWLREAHKLSAEISSTDSGRWMALVYELGATRHFVEAYVSTYDTYEQAVEAALKYSLENLI